MGGGTNQIMVGIKSNNGMPLQDKNGCVCRRKRFVRLLEEVFVR